MNVDFSDPWVKAALSGKLDREAYAAHLRAIGDPRAELIALANRLAVATQDDPAGRARLAELRPHPESYWWRIFAPEGWVLGCGGKERNGLLKMAVECDRSWAEMTPTEDPQIRSCDACRERVYRVTTRGEAAAHARAGHCISAEGDAARGIYASVDKVMVTGRPHAPTYWARGLIDR